MNGGEPCPLSPGRDSRLPQGRCPPDGAIRPRNLRGNPGISSQAASSSIRAPTRPSPRRSGGRTAAGQAWRFRPAAVPGPATQLRYAPPVQGAGPPSAGLNIRRSLGRCSAAVAGGDARTRPRAVLRGAKSGIPRGSPGPTSGFRPSPFRGAKLPRPSWARTCRGRRSIRFIFAAPALPAVCVGRRDEPDSAGQGGAGSARSRKRLRRHRHPDRSRRENFGTFQGAFASLPPGPAVARILLGPSSRRSRARRATG